MNLTNYSIDLGSTLYVPPSYSAEEVISNFCVQWSGLTFDSHNFYMVFISVFFVCGLLRRVPMFNKKTRYTHTLFETENKYLKPFSEWYIDLHILKMIQHICVYTIIFRIIQVWYITNYMIG